MAKGMVTGKASKGHGKRKATHMNISRADNGFMAETHYEKPKSSASARKAMLEDYEPPERTVFGDHAALSQHVANTFGEPDEDDQAA